MPAAHDPLRPAEDEFIDAVGAAIEFWGFKRILGNVWAWLYVEGEPRSAAAIIERLGVSKAAVSTAVAQLEHWGCVYRIRKPGERREVYSAESDIWRMVSRVFREREMRRVDQALESFDRVMRVTREAMSGGADMRARARAFQGRVERVAALARIARTAMELALEKGRADLRPLRGR